MPLKRSVLISAFANGSEGVEQERDCNLQNDLLFLCNLVFPAPLQDRAHPPLPETRR
jgi:hypothetical protein